MKINLQAVRNVFSPFEEINALRYETLRNETFNDHAITEIPADSKEYHLVLYKGVDIAANFTLSPLNKEVIFLQKIHVREDVWHPGMEHKLLAYAENWAKENGFKEIQVNCGATGVPFYSKLKYTSTDTSTTTQGILYHQMVKKLETEL
jgi:N-acetylglutamate synthase-like GNAT family acetyltransferase